MYRIIKSHSLVLNLCRSALSRGQIRLSATESAENSGVGELFEEKFQKCQEKLLYNCYLNQMEVKVGYVQNKVIASKLEQFERQQRASVKSFPLALKLLEPEVFDTVEPPTAVEEPPKQSFYIPYSHARPIATVSEEPSTSWMHDYEHYDESEESHGAFGTADPSVPVSETPCAGCGAHLHCADAALPGYLPKEIFKNRTRRELAHLNCQRCHLLKNYNTAINVTVTPADYVRVISSIRDKRALAVLMVDLLELENSIWPGIRDILGDRRPIVVVGNKVDLLPRDSPGHLEHVRKCVQKAVNQAGFDEANVMHISLISATTGFGVEELITKIHNVWGRNGDVYIVGCTNVGKSSLFNALLNSDFCKVNFFRT